MAQAKLLSLAKIRTSVLVTEATVPMGEDLDSEIVTVATKSKELLGYDVLFNKVVTRKKLDELGIEIYTKESVWDYFGLVYGRAFKKQEDKKANKKVAAARDYADEEDDESGSSSESSPVGRRHGGPSVAKKKYERSNAVRKNTPRSLLELGWVRLPINVFNKEIPPHVLDRAIRVKEAIPESEFFITSFDPQEAQREVAIIDDPFLELVVGEEFFYIDVWDEQDFERKLEK